MAERRGRRKGRPGDGLEPDFGPGFDPAEAAPADAGTGDRAPDTGSRIPCGKDGCLLKPIGDLAARFALELARRGHSESAARAAISGIELLKAFMNAHNLTDRQLGWMVGIHVTFLFSGLLYAAMDRLAGKGH